METHSAENSEQKPSAFESPARLAGGAPSTSALGLGDTPSSHASPADPGLGGLGGGASSPAACSPDGQGLGTRRLLERSRATGWGGKKSERCPGPSPWKADPGPWLVSRSSRAWGRGRKPLKPDTSRQGKLRRLVSWGGQPGCYCWNVFPPTRGFAERLACEKEVRRGWGDVGRRRRTPGLERGSGGERPGSAASTRDSGAGVMGARMSQKTGWCLSLFWSSPIKQLVGILKKEPGLAMSVSFHLYLKDNRNNNSSSSSCFEVHLRRSHFVR